MVNYACSFNQSGTGKRFEWVIMSNMDWTGLDWICETKDWTSTCISLSHRIRKKKCHKCLDHSSLGYWPVTMCLSSRDPGQHTSLRKFIDTKHFKHSLKYLMVCNWRYLRASSCKYREWDDSREISDFFIFCPNNLYSELFSKIPFKGPEAL